MSRALRRAAKLSVGVTCLPAGEINDHFAPPPPNLSSIEHDHGDRISADVLRLSHSRPKKLCLAGGCNRRLKVRLASAECLSYSGAGHLRIITRCATPCGGVPLTAANAEHVDLTISAPINGLAARDASTRAPAAVPACRASCAVDPTRIVHRALRASFRRDDEPDMV